MADFADEAQDAMEQAAYLASLVRKQPPSLPVGECLECGDTTPGSFCCPDCRDGYELREKMRRISGQG